MDCAPGSGKQQKFFSDILVFVEQSSGLRGYSVSECKARIHQSADGKSIDIETEQIEDVLFRSDTEGEEFIQVNFVSGHKILLTDTLIGFKPAAPKGLDVSKLPRVVTTPDVVNVFEAIQDALHSAGPDSHELNVLKRVFEAVLTGGEAVGFDLSNERSWLARIPSAFTKIAS